MSVVQTTCDFAGIRFTFNGLSLQAFNRHYEPFANGRGPVDFFCDVDVAGPSEELCGLRCPTAWNFTRRDGVACVTGANPAGEVLWRLVGSEPYARLRFEWHPVAYDALYRNETYGSYGIVALLALVLRLLPLGGLVLHGSAQVIEGGAVICTGPSGKGKSTISRLFDRCGVAVLTDERPLVRACGEEGFRVYGSPWPSSGGFALNASAPLRKVYFLEHGPEASFEPLTRREAVLRLLDVAMVPWLDAAFFDPVIRTLESLLAAVPYAVLRFRPDPTAVEAVRRDLNF